jgi:murein DD-endopeptidase MepM/ murein hydrolase activator NlpD
VINVKNKFHEGAAKNIKFFFKKNLIFFFALFFLVLPANATSTLDALREAERRNLAARQRVSEQQNILAGTQLELSNVMREMQELDQQITDVMEIIETIELDLLATLVRIEAANEDLALAQLERENQMEILSTRVRVMHEQGSVGLLEVLFQAENIADFFARWEYIRTITQFDQDLLAQLQKTEERVASGVDTLNRSQVLISELQAEHENAKLDLEKTAEEKRIFIIQLEGDSEKHAEYLDILAEEAHAINLQFVSAQARHREHLAEQERRRREEEDRRRREAAERAAAERAAQMSTLNPIGTFVWPLAIRGTITSEFGTRNDPFTGRPTKHEGLDISAPAGTQILAAEAGFVHLANWGVGYGNYIIINHADGYSTLYAHNSRNRVSEGQRVTRGQHIADVGTTGRSTGNHLHFEVRKNGVHQNPMNYLR